ncbi:MAG: hypothetical protein LBS11_11535 [Oscillospiraceae bacterium]|nr:hypothetical protein [Oscillospiraceae bacterium]
MKKNIKVAALLMALMLLVSTAAFASSPSTETITKPVTGYTDAGTTAGEGTAEDAKVAEKVLAEITVAATKTGGGGATGGAALTYFTPTVRAQIAAIAPTVKTVAQVVPVKFGGTFSSGNFVWNFGNVALKVGMPVVVVAGVQEGGLIVWYPLSSSVVQVSYQTFVKFYIPKEIYVKGPTLLSILV